MTILKKIFKGLFKDEFDTKDNEIQSLKDSLSEEKQVIREKDSLIHQLEAALFSLRNEVEDLTRSRDLIEEEASGVRRELKNAQDKNRANRNEIRNLNGQIEHYKEKALKEARRAEELLGKLAPTRMEMGAVRRELALLQREYKAVLEDFENLKRKSEEDLIKRVKEISRLNRIISELKSQIYAIQEASPKQENISDVENVSLSSTSGKQISPKKYKRINKKFEYPYITRPPLSEDILKTKDFPKIENDNIFAASNRRIDEVLDCRTNKLVSANSIFPKWSPEEISKLRHELEEARRTNEPYLICPCCRQMLIISGRTIGFGDNGREIQYFTHAVRNIPCDLKRDYAYDVPIDGTEVAQIDDYHKEICNLLWKALTSDTSITKGIYDVKESDWIFSELPIMQRRLADVTAVYKDRKIVFELVTHTTTLSKVRDKDIFYRINKHHVFWLFGLNSTVDYNELLRSVAKDIIFTNKRNVFVFDIEAQQESQRLGELMLKCNWLDEDNEWKFELERDGKNGILVSIDKIKFDDNSCRPYYFDADEPYYQNHPNTERPVIISREELFKHLTEAWDYKISRDNAVKEMDSMGKGVEVFFNGEKWGFKYGTLIFIEPTFDKEPEIFGAYAKVCIEGKYGAVSRFGEISLQAIYEVVEILPNNRLLYSDGKEWYIFGIINHLTSFFPDDEIKIELFSETDSIYRLTIKRNLYEGQNPIDFIFFGDLIFKRDQLLEKWILWYCIGGKVTDKTWDNIEITSDNQLRLCNGKKILLLFLDGTVSQEVINKEPEYLEKKPLKNGFFIFKHVNGYWGILDDKNDYAVNPQYDSIEIINDDFLKFLSDGKWGVFSIAGELLIKPLYNSIISYCDGEFQVTMSNPEETWENLHGKVDIQGNPLSDIILVLNNSLKITKLFGRFGLESESGIVIHHKYKALSHWDGDKYIAMENSHLGIIDIEGNILLPFKYSQISNLDKNRAKVKEGSRTFFINSDCQIIEDEAINLQDGYKKIKSEGKWGIIGPDGSELIPPKYDEITTFRGRLIGFINNSVIKLNQYYPYWLPMCGKNIYSDNSKLDLVDIQGVICRLLPKRKEIINNESVMVTLCNLMYNVQYPHLKLYDENIGVKRTRHIDRTTDFIQGKTYHATVTGFIVKGKNGEKKRGVDLLVDNDRISHIYRRDLMHYNLDISSLSIGDKLIITKIGFDDELDRTIWEIHIPI